MLLTSAQRLCSPTKISAYTSSRDANTPGRSELADRFAQIDSSDAMTREVCRNLQSDLADEDARGEAANTVHIEAIEVMQELAACYRYRHHKMLDDSNRRTTMGST